MLYVSNVSEQHDQSRNSVYALYTRDIINLLYVYIYLETLKGNMYQPTYSCVAARALPRACPPSTLVSNVIGMSTGDKDL